MHPLRKKRLLLILFIFTGTLLAALLTLFALKQNINLYFTPSQVAAGNAPYRHEFRMGGLVKRNSIHRGDNLKIDFVLTDTAHDIHITYRGVLPDLFGEGQGVVVQGKLIPPANGSTDKPIDLNYVFIADQILAKHGASYMPKPALDAIATAKQHDAS